MTMKLPCARHPANHLLVQELLILASLCGSEEGSHELSGRLYNIAKGLACSLVAHEESMAHPISYPPFSHGHARHEGKYTQAHRLFVNSVLERRVRRMHEWYKADMACWGTAQHTRNAGHTYREDTDNAISHTDENAVHTGGQHKHDDIDTGVSNHTCIDSHMINNDTATEKGNHDSHRDDAADEKTKLESVLSSVSCNTSSCTLPAVSKFYATPARIVALYGSRSPMPSLPSYCHDDVTYDEAVCHRDMLTCILGPFDFHVSLSAHTRRGCPCATYAEFVLCCSAEVHTCKPSSHARPHTCASQHSSSYCNSGDNLCRSDANTYTCNTIEDSNGRSNGSSGDGSYCGGDGCRGRGHYYCPSQAIALTSATKMTAAQSAEHLNLLRTLDCERCDCTEATATVDRVSPTLAHRYRSALRTLQSCGYVVSDKSLSRFAMRAEECLLDRPSHARDWNRGIAITARQYARHRSHTVPPFHLVDARELSEVRLHRLVLHFVPHRVYELRQLFHTGPAAFVKHVILCALRVGLDVNRNGVFLCPARCVAAQKDGERELVSAADTASDDVQANSETAATGKSLLPYMHATKKQIACDECEANQSLSSSDTELLTRDDGTSVQAHRSIDPTGFPEPALSCTARGEKDDSVFACTTTQMLPCQNTKLDTRPTQRMRVMVHSEKDIFALCGLPFVDPINRAIYCQVNNLFDNAVISKST